MSTEQKHLLIIGAMKCGTSSLFDYLSQHPDIAGAVVKEPEYFSQHQEHSYSVSHYDDLWPDNNTEKYLMEASTGYTKAPLEQQVIQRILASGIKPKLIYVVRDPVERIKSHLRYIQNTTLKKITINEQIIATSRYYYQLKPYVDAFGRDNVLVLDFDLLADAPATLLDQVYQFLDVEKHYPDSFEVSNKTQKLSTVQKLVRRFAVTRMLTRILPKSLVNAVKSKLPHHTAHIEYGISEEQESEIRHQLNEDMQSFAAEFHFNVKKWGFEA